jgi:GGDEF domain-containing protein
VSIGQAFYAVDGSNAGHLLAEADRRMYAVKNSHYANTADRHTGVRFARATS